MIEAINNVLVHLFGISNLVFYVGQDIILNINVGYYLSFAIIFISSLIISSIFIWFFHIIFEKECD